MRPEGSRIEIELLEQRDEVDVQQQEDCHIKGMLAAVLPQKYD